MKKNPYDLIFGVSWRGHERFQSQRVCVRRKTKKRCTQLVEIRTKCKLPVKDVEWHPLEVLQYCTDFLTNEAELRKIWEYLRDEYLVPCLLIFRSIKL